MEQSEFIHENNISTERLWSNLKEKIKEVVEKHIPLKERVVGKHPKPMWWNRKIYRLRKNRLKWWHRYNERKRKEDENKYLHYQREVTKEIRKAKRKLEKRLGENIKTDRKGFFNPNLAGVFCILIRLGEGKFAPPTKNAYGD